MVYEKSEVRHFMDNKLNLKDEIQKCYARVSVLKRETKPTCKTWENIPFGNLTWSFGGKGWMEEGRYGEETMWSVAPISMIQKLLSNRKLLANWPNGLNYLSRWGTKVGNVVVVGWMEGLRLKRKKYQQWTDYHQHYCHEASSCVWDSPQVWSNKLEYIYLDHSEDEVAHQT